MVHQFWLGWILGGVVTGAVVWAIMHFHVIARLDDIEVRLFDNVEVEIKKLRELISARL